MAKSHHYSPQVYLRQFTNPKAKAELWEYDLIAGSVKKSSPKDSGCENYYNSVALSEGGRDDETIETAFHPLENNLPKLFKAVRNKEPMTGNLWSLFFTFAAIQNARDPSTVGTIDEFLGQIHQTSFEMLCKGSSKFQKSLSAHGINPLKAPDMISMKAGQGAGLLLSLQTISESAKILAGMKWGFINAPPDKFFFTSDHPVCPWTPPETRTIYSGGFTDREVEITFPLSRRVCACGHWTMVQPKDDAAISSKVDAINRRTVRNGRNFIFGPTMNPEILALVRAKASARRDT